MRVGGVTRFGKNFNDEFFISATVPVKIRV
jgi:hypothetical protein